MFIKSILKVKFFLFLMVVFIAVTVLYKTIHFKNPQNFLKSELSLCQNASSLLEKASFQTIGTVQHMQLSNMKKKMYLLNFWGVDCAPCVEEWPSLVQFVKTTQIPLVALSEDSQKRVKEFFKTLKMSLFSENIYLGQDVEGKIRKSLSVQAIPQTFLIGPEGRVLRIFVGSENWTSHQMLFYFNFILENVYKNPSALCSKKELEEKEIFS